MPMTPRHICIAIPPRQWGPLVPCTRQWGPCRLDVLKPTPPQRPKIQIHLDGHQAAVGKDLDALSAEFLTMSFSQVVCDLGVLLDPELTFSHHIDQVCRSCYYQLHQLRVIARSLTFNAAVSLVHAFVFSRLDYCSSIFVGHHHHQI